MSKIKGIYAASMSILNDDLTLDIKKTILHAEMVIDNGCHGAAIFGSTGQAQLIPCLLYTSPSPRDKRQSRMPSSA